MSKKMLYLTGLLLVFFLFFIYGCGSKSPEGEKSLLDEDWSQILKEARGTTVNFYMWGGNESINKWVDTFVADRMEKYYGVKVNRVPMDADQFINKLLGEKQAGRQKGSIDLLWINGENFRTTRQADLLWGPFADKLPNFQKYVDKNAPDIANDFGYPVNGYEVPWGRAQFVFAYDSRKVKNPPRSAAELMQWVKEHPGRFTYPELPDFTGSVFVRQLMYELCGGYKAFPTVQKVDKDALDRKLAALWNYCNEMKPYLWRSGKTYPSTIAALHQLFADGEVDFTMTYNPAEISCMIKNGLLSDTVRTFVWDRGTIGNTHFLAIPFNAPNKAGAMVLANFLLSPEAQLSKYDPKNWGDMLALDVSKLEPEYIAQMKKVDRGVATLPEEELQSHRLPEISSAYIPVIEDLWKKNVLTK
ncbi:MAG: ABC transporter substrate-binding protein [Firmicutes bacterium]|nr:ABC transporter substrate-binding protein [Bacillota bacterium]